MKALVIVGGLLSSLPGFSQTIPPPSNLMYRDPEWVDYLPAVGIGILIGFVACFVIISFTDRHFWKNIKV